jgi:YHS domain-containing protein
MADIFSDNDEQFRTIPEGYVQMADIFSDNDEQFRTIPEGYVQMADIFSDNDEQLRTIPEGPLHFSLPSHLHIVFVLVQLPNLFEAIPSSSSKHGQ